MVGFLMMTEQQEAYLHAIAPQQIQQKEHAWEVSEYDHQCE